MNKALKIALTGRVWIVGLVLIYITAVIILDKSIEWVAYLVIGLYIIAGFLLLIVMNKYLKDNEE